MVKILTLVWGWIRANRPALCFVALGVLMALVGVGTKVPRWVGKVVVYLGGNGLRDAVTNLYETYYASGK